MPRSKLVKVIAAQIDALSAAHPEAETYSTTGLDIF